MHFMYPHFRFRQPSFTTRLCCAINYRSYELGSTQLCTYFYYNCNKSLWSQYNYSTQHVVMYTKKVTMTEEADTYTSHRINACVCVSTPVRVGRCECGRDDSPIIPTWACAKKVLPATPPLFADFHWSSWLPVYFNVPPTLKLKRRL